MSVHPEQSGRPTPLSQSSRRAIFAAFQERCIHTCAQASPTDRHAHCHTQEERSACVAAMENASCDCLNALLARVYYDLRQSTGFSDLLRSGRGPPRSSFFLVFFMRFLGSFLSFVIVVFRYFYLFIKSHVFLFLCVRVHVADFFAGAA